MRTFNHNFKRVSWFNRPARISNGTVAMLVALLVLSFIF
jgi:hypothetical protein